ncbi:universal stress protein, partial [Shewanella atlantica]
MVDESGTKTTAFDQAAMRLREAEVSVSENILSGRVDEALLNYQQEQQLEMIVMGAFGHSKLRQ